jgi:hypothetical protein
MSDVPCIPISSLYFNLGRPCHILSALCAYSRKHAIPFAILKDHTLRIERALYYSFFFRDEQKTKAISTAYIVTTRFQHSKTRLNMYSKKTLSAKYQSTSH